jgi:hypothetical protein
MRQDGIRQLLDDILRYPLFIFRIRISLSGHNYTLTYITFDSCWIIQYEKPKGKRRIYRIFRGHRTITLTITKPILTDIVPDLKTPNILYLLVLAIVVEFYL